MNIHITDEDFGRNLAPPRFTFQRYTPEAARKLELRYILGYQAEAQKRKGQHLGRPDPEDVERDRAAILDAIQGEWLVIADVADRADLPRKIASARLNTMRKRGMVRVRKAAGNRFLYTAAPESEWTSDEGKLSVTAMALTALESGPLTARELHDKIGFSLQGISRAMTDAYKAGKVQRVSFKRDHGGRYYRYSVVAG